MAGSAAAQIHMKKLIKMYDTIKKSANSRYVAHFDVIGFKQATLKSPDDAWGMLSDVELLMSQITSSALEDKDSGEIIANRIQARIFSDTVLIFTLSDTPNDLKSILILANHFFVNCLSVCVPVRGGMSYGDFYFNHDQNLYCGIPFVRAYDLGEEAQWMGIVLDEIIGRHYRGKLIKKDSKKTPLITEWAVPLKNKLLKKEWVVNRPHFMKLGEHVELPLSAAACYESFNFKKLFGEFEFLPDDVKSKYQNTAEFFNHQLLGQEDRAPFGGEG